MRLSAEDAQRAKGLPTEALLEKLHACAGETPAINGIIAAKKLPSGNILLHTDSLEAKLYL